MASLWLLLAALGQAGPTPPAPPDAPLPSSFQPGGVDSPSAAPPSVSGAGPDLPAAPSSPVAPRSPYEPAALPPKPAALPEPPLPRSLTLDALSAELKAAATAGHARAREEQARIDEDKKKLKDMAAQIELARHELRAETLALEQLTQSESPGTGGPRGRRAVLGRLAKTIQGMKPAQAASLLERLEPGLAVELFRQMRPGDAAPIVEQLKPDLAAHFFTALAARAPTNKELSP